MVIDISFGLSPISPLLDRGHDEGVLALIIRDYAGHLSLSTRDQPDMADARVSHSVL